MTEADGFGEFFSRYEVSKGKSKVEYFVDINGSPTIDYPHVHIVFRINDVDIIASYNREIHLYRKTIPEASGEDVNAAVKEAIEDLKSYLDLFKGSE